MQEKNRPILANHKLADKQRICGTVRRTNDSPVWNVRNRAWLNNAMTVEDVYKLETGGE